ncbi:hypothetical protein QR90_14120 [Deinococcus radiopugnans]|uniref:DUF1440 domain-containing protein n=2 Tax=Deinococcus radiopugnans TaxID=57497 RepID=A0A0A7KKS9_9DEIO|nr:hypothetical protein QR90_14120 [Deinococcus radiopugnans]
MQGRPPSILYLCRSEQQFFLRWSMALFRNIVIGLVGGAVGTLAMGQYWTRVAPLLQDDEGESSGDHKPTPDRHSIAPLGQLHAPGESSTAALGRLAYEAAEGHTPKKEGTRTALSEGIHWGMGVLNGGLYGALAGPREPLKAAIFGVGLWALMDEGLVPLMGLQDGPGGSTPRGHINRLGAHLAYGLGLGLTALALDRMLPDGK